MSSQHRTVDAHSKTLSENEKDDNNNQTENDAESPHDQTSVEPNRNTTEHTRQSPLQIPDSSSLKCLLDGYKNHL